MTTQLIPYTPRSLNGETVQTVDGRDLHAFLGIVKDFNAWMRHQIKRARLVEGRDFVTYQQVGATSRGQRQIDYYVTFDAAKHIGMLSGSEKGHEVREYFLACEKALQGKALALSPLDAYPELKAIASLVHAIAEQRHELESMKEDQRRQDQALIQTQALTLRLLEAQQWITIRAYVAVHGLAHQIPEADQRAYARWLGTYCLEHGMPMYKAQTADVSWPDERTYHAGTIQATLPGWLARHQGQAGLAVVR